MQLIKNCKTSVYIIKSLISFNTYLAGREHVSNSIRLVVSFDWVVIWAIIMTWLMSIFFSSGCGNTDVGVAGVGMKRKRKISAPFF